MAQKWPHHFQISNFEEDRFILVGVVNKNQLKTLYEMFEPLSRSWRGQYQAMAKAIVEACSTSINEGAL